MLRHRVAWLLVAVCLAWPAAASAQSATRGLRAERFDVALTLLPDGSVDVRETVVFHFSEKTFSKVEREIPIRRMDGIIDVRAFLDGQPLADDGTGARARIRSGRRMLRVTWTFPDTIDRSRAFTLEYRAMGALSVEHGRASLDWFVLPSRHRYEIDEARVEWRVPASTLRVTPTTLDDPRWTSSALPDGWSAVRRQVGVDETARLSDAFDASTLAVTPPVWQIDADYALQLAPAFVVGALTLLVMGAGVVGMMRFRYYRPARRTDPAVPAPHAGLPAAMGTALVRSSLALGLPQMQATLLGLAQRGLVTFEQNREKPKRFDLVLSSSRPSHRHEQVLVDAVWLHAKSGRIDLEKAWRHAARAFPAFRRQLLDDLEAAGLVDAERRGAARGLRTAGIAVALLGMAGVAAFAILLGHLGSLPLIVPGAVVVCGVAFMIASHLFSLLTAAGEAAGAEWRARRQWIKAARKNSLADAEVALWFPVAAGFGLARAWLKAGSTDAGATAAAFQWLGDVRDPGAALAVILSSTTTTTSGGVGGGGAAGGGSSSAS